MEERYQGRWKENDDRLLESKKRKVIPASLEKFCFKPFITFAKSFILDLTVFHTLVSVVSASSYEIYDFSPDKISV